MESYAVGTTFWMQAPRDKKPVKVIYDGQHQNGNIVRAKVHDPRTGWSGHVPYAWLKKAE